MHGFNVKRIYLDSFTGEEKKDYEYLKENYPDLELYATVDIKSRFMASSSREKLGATNISNSDNEKSALILSYMIITVPFTLWVMTNFMRSIPKEIEEAAIMDGASRYTILTKVFLPILKPAIVTTGLLAFIAAWNEFLFALTFTLTNQARTVPVSLALFSGASQHELPWGLIMAASVLVTLPLIVLVVIFQRRIISGLTAGSVKG